MQTHQERLIAALGAARTKTESSIGGLSGLADQTQKAGASGALARREIGDARSRLFEATQGALASQADQVGRELQQINAELANTGRKAEQLRERASGLRQQIEAAISAAQQVDRRAGGGGVPGPRRPGRAA